jgi:hypothetical protein
MSLIGINRNNEQFIAFNPTDGTLNTRPSDPSNGYNIPENTFAVGTSNELAIAKFREVHIGNGTLKINESGNFVKEDGTVVDISLGTNTGSRISMTSPNTMNRTQADPVQCECESKFIRYTANEIGKIVVSCSEYLNVNSDKTNMISNISTDNATPIVEFSTRVQDKRVFGVISGRRNGRIIVQTMGSGTVKVCNEGGAIKTGDFITTSTIPGIGKRQNEDYVLNSTVAKVTENCDFVGQHDGIAVVKCSYYCG